MTVYVKELWSFGRSCMHMKAVNNMAFSVERDMSLTERCLKTDLLEIIQCVYSHRSVCPLPAKSVMCRFVKQVDRKCEHNRNVLVSQLLLQKRLQQRIVRLSASPHAVAKTCGNSPECYTVVVAKAAETSQLFPHRMSDIQKLFI